MKTTVTNIGCLIVVLFFLMTCSQSLFAQGSDTLDVTQGYETLNIAILSDTDAAGNPINPNRVYRLERGGYYLLNGELKSIKTFKLQIVAAKGDGPMPILIPAANEAGASGRVARPAGDLLVQGLYMTGIDNLGNFAEKNMIRIDGKNARIVIDGCFLDYDAQSFCRMNAEGQKYFITNTIMRNSYDLASTGNGRFLDTRGNTQDTIFVQNCTWYACCGEPIRTDRCVIKNLIMDHVTIYEGNGELNTYRAINCKVTNNLFIDMNFEGRVKGDSLGECIVAIDSLKSPSMATEGQRHFTVTNNVQGFTPQVKAWITSWDTLEVYPLHNQRTLRFFATYPNMVSTNNIEEFPVFSDAPDPALVVAFADYHLKTNESEEGNPGFEADRNGKGNLTENPNSVGPAPDEFNFDYKTTSKSYTHAEGGFPVGDLNWFPTKKVAWQEWIKTDVATDNSAEMPEQFSLQQNYPNPFNPTTNIAYKLHAPSFISLAIYNSLGQKIRMLISDKKQQAGDHIVQWDGRDDSDHQVASGLYFYRLQVGEQIQSKKMLLMK